MEFHVSRTARDRYQFEDAIFSFDGRAIVSNLEAARTFANRANQLRPATQQVLPAQLNAIGLLDELMHAVIAAFREDLAPGAIHGALTSLNGSLGTEAVDRTLVAFCDQFPTVDVYHNKQQAAVYLEGATNGVPNREVALEELLILSLTNQNPATANLREFFDDKQLTSDTAYPAIMPALETYFETLPPVVDDVSLVKLLRQPEQHAPDNLLSQLEFVSTQWRAMFRERRAVFFDSMLDLLQVAGNQLREEDKWLFALQNPRQHDNPGLVAQANPMRYDEETLRGLGMLRDRQVSRVGADGNTFTETIIEPEPEKFTADREWMPRLVMIAKSSYVWLDQLGKKYQRAITRLDQVPDEELDQLQRWGITGLWLIGLWERSTASQTIKRMMGNHEAVASAYSLFDYTIAADLGGWDALANLRERAWHRGIRLASDMVPNHMGIDSAWVADHPDWFVQRDQSPYPSYTFGGPDLSRDPRISVHLEDHYWNHSDASVVFKVHDHRDHQDRYIYHGNDGTSTPWNDTAQLDYLKPEVREAVIQNILNVARNFPIIRFDAAMTLAKRHIQRLWFPQPGAADSIPSRSDQGMTRSQLDALMPTEFWRDVVDRAAVEAPDTLLLAEAFWMMEGFFVRTLGMHRVYNSAFMVMMRDEKNAGYRSVIKDTLAFDPQILRRYVNFVNNPDEKSAVDQFGRGPKYFGVTMLMATLPGLPMFGHGQFEGFAEKYGMEFKRALRDEPVDVGLMQHHERVIVPLLKKRYLFADVDRFVLLDFDTDGVANEDVLAFANGVGDERALILFNNRNEQSSGVLARETEIKPQFEHDPDEDMSARRSIGQRRTLSQSLRLPDAANAYMTYRDVITQQEYLVSCRELTASGWRFDLGPYESRAFMDMAVVYDSPEGDYAALNTQLRGRGVSNIHEELLRTREQEAVAQRAAARILATGSEHFDLLVHATHEAGIKIGGIGAVLDGLLSAPSYASRVKRTILVGPMHTHNAIEMERLFAPRNGIVHFHYFSDRQLISCEPRLATALGDIERRYSVRICYATKLFGEGASAVPHEVIMVDGSDASNILASDFKFGVWERFGLDCARYEYSSEFNEYMRLALPAFDALQAVVETPLATEPGSNAAPPTDRTIVCHEFMGLPLFYAATLMQPGAWRSAYVAHEVPGVRAAVEMSSGHDTRFYNIMRAATRDGLTMDEALGDPSGYFKHAMLKTATQCDRVLAVSDITADELRFVDRRFRRKGVSVAYNGAPAKYITLAQRNRARQKLRAVAYELAGFEPTHVFSHVTRLVDSKALWRDVGVMRHLDHMLADRSERAVLLMVSSAAATGRSADDAKSMARTYGWPTYHRVGWPDLIDGELNLWRAISAHNARARATRIVLVNQFGFDARTLGGSIPQDVTFNDLRQGTDVEFGQSIYEPFGIAQIEPLTYGALCAVSDSCGCKFILTYRAPGSEDATHPTTTGDHAETAKNIIVGNYTQLSWTPDLRSAINIGQHERNDAEGAAAWSVAGQITERLPRTDDERLALLESGYALAAGLSWDVVARHMFLPGIS